MEKEKKDWFTQLFPEIPSEYPPDMKISDSNTHRVTFKEKRPRLVTGGYGKKTAVINVLYNGQKRSLYVGSNVDLARHIYGIWNKNNQSLLNLKVDITRTEKVGRNWRYTVTQV